MRSRLLVLMGALAGGSAAGLVACNGGPISDLPSAGSDSDPPPPLGAGDGDFSPGDGMTSEDAGVRTLPDAGELLDGGPDAANEREADAEVTQRDAGDAEVSAVWPHEDAGGSTGTD